MPHLIQTQFAKYALTASEELGASIFTSDQKIFIQNQLASIAEQILALTPDPLNYPVFIQSEAYLKGQLAAYQYLLDCSVVSEAVVLEEARNQE